MSQNANKLSDRKASNILTNFGFKEGPNKQLPKVNFKKINKLRVYANQQGTGKELREDLMTMGGAAKFYRTKRMNNLINKPMSMWEATHFTTSSKVQAI